MALSEYVPIIGQAQLPVAWLEGDVLAEYVRFLEEVEEKAPVDGPGGVKWLEGDVLAEFMQFLGEDVQEGGGSSSGCGDHMDEEDENMDEQDEDDEMEHLLRHIMSLPAFMARAAAAAE